MSSVGSNPTRVFENSPGLFNGAAAAAYLLAVKPKSYAGYVGPDGTVRLMVELDPSDERSAER